MTISLSEDERALVDRFEQAGQGHVFRFLDRLDAAGREALFRQTEEIDLTRVAELAATAGAPPRAPGNLEPATVLRPDELPGDELREARERGEDLLARGTVAALLVAGGQATRLGYDGPKGAYPLGPVSGRTLFEWFAGRLRALADRHGRPVPLYVMTSEATHEATVEYFRSRDWLGLGEEGVKLFRQGMAPALDDDGRLLLESPGRVFVAPNGHGGVFEALQEHGILDELDARGLAEIFYFQVDNALVRIADPVFLGLHHGAAAGMSTKVVEKTDPAEKVGVVVRRDGHLEVVEYSELSEAQMEERGPDGRLRYGAGNIAIHAIRTDFARRVAEGGELPFHCARKAVPHVDADGAPVRPASPNATKFERFVFDALPLTESSVTLAVRREEEFAPVKNAEGSDSPETARAALTNRARRWCEEAGLSVGLHGEGVAFDLELDPEFVLDAADVRRRLRQASP
jgi:UDP-N-acetylglucosamine/UDP-N-acetylgalactosamine diphosphorylase